MTVSSGATLDVSYIGYLPTAVKVEEGKSSYAITLRENQQILGEVVVIYGNFSIWHKEADLWLLDLQTGENRPLTEVNSDETESYHSWSSNSRWFVFSSRRIDGLYTRPFIASIDENGKVSKPFLLPQRNPDYYLESLYSFNIPEFANGTIHMDIKRLEKQLPSKERKKAQPYEKISIFAYPKSKNGK